MSSELKAWKRTGMCLDYTEANIGQKITLTGWVDHRRNLGGLIFVWLRDRSRHYAVVFDESLDAGDFAEAESIRNELSFR